MVRVTARRHPVAHEVLVEALGSVPGRETLLVAVAQPVAAAVRRMDLVGEEDLPGRIEAELVFGIDEDQTVLGGDLASAGKE